MGSVDTAGLLLDLKMSLRFLTIHPWVMIWCSSKREVGVTTVMMLLWKSIDRSLSWNVRS